MRTHRFLLAGVAVLGLMLAACGDDDDDGGTSADLSGTIRIDGSSTVAPLSEAAAELFQAENDNVRVTVGTSGTGAGFEKFCNGETDISDASRAIEEDEVQACQSKGIQYEEITVALDGLSVVVNPANDWAECLTVAQLKAIWEPNSKINNWKDIPGGDFPDEPLKLFGAGTDSGTFDYFTGAIVGEEGASRTDYTATEDDNVTVQGVSGTKGGLGYFGLSYLEQNQGKLTGVEVDGGDGCVAASKDTVQSGDYKPLSRPLFIYPSTKALERPEVKAFIAFYLEENAAITEQALFVSLTEDQLGEAREKVEGLTAG